MQEEQHVIKISVIGGGVMGRGIALTCLRAGYSTQLFDLREDILQDAHAYVADFLAASAKRGKLAQEDIAPILERLTLTTDLSACVADVVIEAVPEKLEIKHEVFQKLAMVNETGAIFASNTSTLPITRIAHGVLHPERIVGMHFFNPAPIMKLVEVIGGIETSPQVVEAVVSLAKRLGKAPVLVQDEPGFIVNRVARQFYLESLRCVEEGVGSVASLDRIMEATGFRMGPFRLMDLIGIDTNHAVSQTLYDAFFQAGRFRPSRLQQKMVDAGRWGKKVGRGFHPNP